MTAGFLEVEWEGRMDERKEAGDIQLGVSLRFQYWLFLGLTG